MSAFLGLLPAEPALGALRAHERPVVEDVRWEPERRWHVTIRYTRHDDPSTLGMLGEVADEVVADLAPPVLELGPATERLGRDGTLVVPVRGAEALARSVDEALGGALGPRDEPFYGHLTLARLRRSAVLDTPLLGVALDVGFEAPTLVLIQSTPGPGGSTYVVLHRAEFGG